MSRPHFIPEWKKIFLFLIDSRTDWKPKALLVLAVVYLLWPVDLVPDLIPVLGWLDDLGAGALALWYLSHTAKRYVSSPLPGSKKP